MKKLLQKISLGATTGLGSLLTVVSPVLAAPPLPGAVGAPTGALPGALDYKVSPPSGFFTNFYILFNSLLLITMAIAALLVFGYLIWGGIDWITSGGDKGATEKARGKITAAVIGLIILAASYAVLQLGLNFISAGSLNYILEQAGI